MRYIFFHPKRLLGGGEVLMSQIINSLTYRGYNVTLIDYHDGYVKKHTTCDFVSYPPKDNRFLSDSAIVVSFPGKAILLKKYLGFFSPESKIFVWNIHPHDCTWVFIPGAEKIIAWTGPHIAKFVFNSLASYNRTRDLLLELINKKSLVFMDEFNKRAYNFFLGKKFEGNLLPIPCIKDSNTTNKNSSKIVSDVICCTWLGRIEHFKVKCLIKTILDLYEYSEKEKKKIFFRIIGSGESIEKVKNIVKSKTGTANNFRAKFYGRQPLDKARILIKEKTDLLFAHGTSALEGASMKIPTVVVNSFSKKKYFKLPIYQWLYKGGDAFVGCFVDTPFAGNIDCISIDDVLEDFFSKQNEISELTHEIFQKNHCLDKVIDKFIQYSQQAEYCLSDLNNCTVDKTLFYKVGSLVKKLLKR